METKRIFIVLIFLLTVPMLYTQAQEHKNEITIKGIRFEMNGEPFEYTGISFFNAIYNKEFNRNSQVRKEWLQKFFDTGINVLRIWCQWDNNRGFIENEIGSIHPEELFICVEDHGIGIPKADQDRIFGMFEQVETPLTRKYGGTGLGLYIAKRLIELCEGKILVKSKINKGSRFFVRLNKKGLNHAESNKYLK